MDKNYLVKFGQRIRELRQKTGLSQEKFALMIGMDRTYFSSVESGKRNISLLNIKKIADGLEITVDKLFENFIKIKPKLEDNFLFKLNYEIALTINHLPLQ